MNCRWMRVLIVVAGLAVLSGAKPGDWPQWRGPQRTGLSAVTGLLKEWPEAGPKKAWEVKTVGAGYSSLAVADGRIITQGDLDGVEHIIALKQGDGTVLWSVQPAPVAEALTARVASQLKRLDKDGSGNLEEIEALTGLGTGFLQADVRGDGDPDQLAAGRAATWITAFDKNGNKQIDLSEMPPALLREFPGIDQADRDIDPKPLAARRAQALLKADDKDNDGKVSQAEARRSALRFLFRRIDQRLPGQRRGDGKLTLEEITTYLATREPGRDGLLTAKELATWFTRTYPGRDGVLEPFELRRMFGGYRNGRGNGPRGTPTVVGEKVYVEGGNGDVSCLDVKTGRTLWHVNLVSDLGGGRPGWGYSESPLVVGGRVFVTPGGNKGTVAALDAETGQLAWRSTDVTDGAHYSSPILADVHGEKQIIQFTRTRVVGLEAATGKLRWEYRKTANGTANCATPIYSDGLVFSSSSYGKGGGLTRVTRTGDEFTAEEVYFVASMANHHGGLLLVGEHLYGFGNGGLICMNFKTGKIAWRNRSVGKGSLCYADGDLYCLSERNAVALVAADPEKYVERGRFPIPRSGRPSWAHPVVANGFLYIRDQGTLTCYRVSATP